MEVFTKEEILKLFSETNKAIAETNRVVVETNKGIFELKERQDKTDVQLAKTDAQLAKTDAQLAELAESQKKTDEVIAESQKKTDEVIAELAVSQKKTDEQLKETAKQIAETDVQLKETDASLKRLGKYHGGLSNNVGSATEEFFYNALKKKRTLNGIRFDHVQRNWRKKGYKQNDEFDIVMLNGTAISVIEVKLQAHKDDIEKILTKQKKRFNEIFPEYKDYEQHWALATFSIDDELRKKAQASGLTVLRRDGELLEYNPPI